MAVEPPKENLRSSASNQRNSAGKGRGGRRPGAGAPKGNLNALKTGLYSKQFAALGSILAADSKLRETLLAIGDRLGLKQRRANEIAAVLLTRFVENERRNSGGRLNIDLPVDEWDSIRETAARISGGKYGTDGPQPSAKKIRAGNNHAPNTTRQKESDTNTKRSPKTID